MIDRKVFYDEVRRTLFGGKMRAEQVEGTEDLLDTWGQDYPSVLRNQLAYILATAKHETAHTMLPIREFGKGRGRKYGRPVGPFDHVYYGRGYVQLTWLENYKRAGDEIGVDLVAEPDLALDPEIAAEIIFAGMLKGWFTGRKLEDYVTLNKSDFRNARRIVNGMDRATKIANEARKFDSALQKAWRTGDEPEPDDNTIPEPMLSKILDVLAYLLTYFTARKPNA